MLSTQDEVLPQLGSKESSRRFGTVHGFTVFYALEISPEYVPGGFLFTLVDFRLRSRLTITGSLPLIPSSTPVGKDERREDEWMERSKLEIDEGSCESGGRVVGHYGT